MGPSTCPSSSGSTILLKSRKLPYRNVFASVNCSGGNQNLYITVYGYHRACSPKRAIKALYGPQNSQYIIRWDPIKQLIVSSSSTGWWIINTLLNTKIDQFFSDIFAGSRCILIKLSHLSLAQISIRDPTPITLASFSIPWFRSSNTVRPCLSSSNSMQKKSCAKDLVSSG